MQKLVAIISVLALAALGASGSESWEGQPVTDSLTFVLRMRNEYYDIEKTQEKLVKDVRGCAQFCMSQSECVAFNSGPTGSGSPGSSMSCSLIFVKDLNSLATVDILAVQGFNYYEMECQQFCDNHNAELKVLACAPLNLGITLLSLPNCQCESIKPNCGLLG